MMAFDGTDGCENIRPDNLEQQQTISATPRKRRSPPPKPPTWDQQKALDLAAKGVNPTDIAPVVGVHRTTVSDYLRRALPEFEALQAFRDRLGDSLVLSLARLTTLEDKLLTLLDKEDVLATLTPSEKERLLGRVSIAKGIVFDKLRLHEGKSTGNNSHEIQLRMVHQDMLPPPVSSGPLGNPSEYIITQAENSQ